MKIIEKGRKPAFGIAYKCIELNSNLYIELRFGSDVIENFKLKHKDKLLLSKVSETTLVITKAKPNEIGNGYTLSSVNRIKFKKTNLKSIAKKFKLTEVKYKIANDCIRIAFE